MTFLIQLNFKEGHELDEIDSLSDDDARSEVLSSSCSVTSSTKKKATKDIDDSIPLPYPFPQPKHFSCNVEVALTCKKMTRDTTAKFISSIAGTILGYERYPTNADYQNVSLTIISKYLHLKSSTGSPHV